MDAEKVTKNHVSYIYSKEIILKNLLQQGIISNQDFDRYDQMLYDRYHMDSSLGISRPIISSQSAELPDADQSDLKFFDCHFPLIFWAFLPFRFSVVLFLNHKNRCFLLLRFKLQSLKNVSHNTLILKQSNSKTLFPRIF